MLPKTCSILDAALGSSGSQTTTDKTRDETRNMYSELVVLEVHQPK